MITTALPIDLLKAEFISAFNNHSNLIIKATPGSGKTTRIPLFILEQTNKKIYILEPRRLAAKLASQQVAHELGEEVGKRVGYVFRYERQMEADTQILFLTEGTFLKMLANDPTLKDVGIVILDEFHERHLSTDAALSFVTKIQNELRPDLKILIMSATIETDQLETFLKQFGKTNTLIQDNNRFNLQINYLPNTTSIIQAALDKKVINSIESIITHDLPGDVLVFLPGMKEIREVESRLQAYQDEWNIFICMLHGDLDSDQQSLALMPSLKRKIILSTNIAESSVTINGIQIVIDSGLKRESSFNFFSGLPELKIVKISKASAAQRAGRSNRQADGFCFRLYAELDFLQRPYLEKPEIQKSDLAELYLTSLNLFKLNLNQLNWLEAPPENALTKCHDLLIAINAVDELNQITPIGIELLRYPLHPRLARIAYKANHSSIDIFRQTIQFLAEFLGEKNKNRFLNHFSYNANNQLNHSLEQIVLSGYPDRIAKSRGEKYFEVITQNGDSIKIASSLSHEFDPRHPLWIVLDLNNKGEVVKFLPIEEEWLYELNPLPLTEKLEYSWDEKYQKVIAFETLSLGKIVLTESRLNNIKNNFEIQKILKSRVEIFIEELKRSQEYERLLTLNSNLFNIPIDHNHYEIVSIFIENITSFNKDDQDNFKNIYYTEIKNCIDPESIINLDRDLPMSISLTDRRKIPIIYDRSHDPYIESLIQDFYGLTKTPILLNGKLPLTIKLLGPHKRAVQVTKDLESFWNKIYPQMYKELTRDYPRHYWPVNPQSAKPFLLKRQVPV